MLTRNEKKTKEAGRLSFRAPVAVDGPAMYALVERCPPLDLNSRYCYLILCEHFSATSVVAEMDREVLAFVTGYIPPDRRDTLFVWQVAVDSSLRGQGVAMKMLRSLLKRRGLKRVRYVEATVNPSNHASRALFRAVARESNCHFDESLLFAASLFGAGDHEQENIVRVGPLDSVSKTLIRR